jgi:hypothetical protein
MDHCEKMLGNGIPTRVSLIKYEASASMIIVTFDLFFSIVIQAGQLQREAGEKMVVDVCGGIEV